MVRLFLRDLSLGVHDVQLRPASSMVAAAAPGEPPSNETLIADQGSFELAGQSAGQLAGRTIAAVQGAFTVGGQNVGIIITRRHVAEQGSFAFNAQNAGLPVT